MFKILPPFLEGTFESNYCVLAFFSMLHRLRESTLPEKGMTLLRIQSKLIQTVAPQLRAKTRLSLALGSTVVLVAVVVVMEVSVCVRCVVINFPVSWCIHNP